MTSCIYAFGGFRLDAGRRLLFGADGTPVPLNSRAFETLLLFVENPQVLLEKQRLLKAIWPNAVVEENNLNQCVWALRRALGETPGEHRFIVTVPGRGYRFVATVTVVPADCQPESPPVEPAPDVAPITGAGGLPPMPPPTALPDWRVRVLVFAGLLVLASVIGLLADRGESRMSAVLAVREHVPAIAVLPLADMSPGGDQEYFADGLSEELLAQLGRQSGLSVISRTSSFAFKGRNIDLRRVGRQLGADFVLEGSVRRSADRLRVTAQLVETVRGTRLWSQSFDRGAGDPLVAQEEIARDVTAALAARLREIHGVALEDPGIGTRLTQVR